MNPPAKYVTKKREAARKVMPFTSHTYLPNERENELLSPPLKARFTTGHFSKAGRIVRALKRPDLCLVRPNFWTDDERILTYELIVAILKYSTFLQDALEKSAFYERYKMPADVGEEEVMCILYNLLERGFRISDDDVELSEQFTEIQAAVLASKTKIMAHMARLRIKHEVNSIDHLLPENLRHQHHIDKNPLYAWINLRKISPPDVLTYMRGVGLKLTKFEDDILIQERLFCVDPQHPDLLRFHSKKSDMVQALPLTLEGKIVVQDKSACIYVYALVKALFFKEAISRNDILGYLNPNPPTISRVPSSGIVSEKWYDGILDGSGKYYVKSDCIVVTHCGSGRSAAHLACLLVEAVPRYLSKSSDMNQDGDLTKAIESKFISRPPLNVLAFGVEDHRHEEIRQVFKKQFGLTNIRMFREDFVDVPSNDIRLKGAAAILVNPPSSGSALKDPVAYICSEGGDENILTQLSKFVSSSISAEGYKRYTSDQVKCLRHSLTFPNVKLIMYTTCSLLKCENSDVVVDCLAEAGVAEDLRKTEQMNLFVLNKANKLCRETTFATVDLSQVMDGYLKAAFQEDFIEIPPSSASSGVFVALIRRKDQIVNLAKQRSSMLSEAASSSTANGTLSSSTNSQSSAKVEDAPKPKMQVALHQELARYIAMSHSLSIDSPLVQARLQEFARTPSAATEKSVEVPPVKQKQSKNAIIKRICIPTHASLAKQKEKWHYYNQYETYSPSSRPTTAPALLGNHRTPSRPSGRKPFGEIAPSNSVCNHNSRDCSICTRHARMYPDKPVFK